MNLLENLSSKGLAHPPKWLITNTMYLTATGSQAYGYADDDSDIDVYGFAMPPKAQVFPHLNGVIQGFGQQQEPFAQYLESHIADGDKKYDLTVFSIVKYFHLCMDNNPNMLDTLFTPRKCVIHSTVIAEKVRSSRRSFLHAGALQKFRGYALSQLTKMKNKRPQIGSKREESILKYGYDTKFAAHIVRLMLEGEQIVRTGDLDISCNAELLRGIRRGEWTQQAIEEWFEKKDREFDAIDLNALPIPEKPNEPVIRQLLLDCLEHHYGSLKNVLGDYRPTTQNWLEW